MTDFELAHAYDTVNLFRRGGAAKIELMCIAVTA